MSRHTRTEEVASHKVCNQGCSPDMQPIENFYKYTTLTVRGFPTYSAMCKKCRLQRGRDVAAGAARQPVGRKSQGKGTPRRWRPVGGESMKLLSTVDLIPCDDCGLRGHYPGDTIKCHKAAARSTGLGGADWII